MDIKRILAEQIKLVSPDKKEVEKLTKQSTEFAYDLKKNLLKSKIDADAFIGGSFGKGTLVKKNTYDVDIYVRFDWEYDNISDLLEPALKKTCAKFKMKYERIHGSRDYFRAFMSDNEYFEVIPVTRINKPKEERNVTDLSYFHVGYVKKKIKGLENEVRLAKSFMQANRVYGAETYVRGFSGYAVECLIIYYGSFIKMLKELAKKQKDRIVIDLDGQFKRKNDIFFELNENKLKSPIILIDPTYKERNALAALSQETFEKFQKAAKDFLSKPSVEFFKLKEVDEESLRTIAKRNKADFVVIQIETEKQHGDIAGTKLKKFSDFLSRQVEKYFSITKKEFVYDGWQAATLYLVLKSKKEFVRIGPPIKMKKHVSAFKKEHLNTYEKNGFIHAKITVNFTPESYIHSWKKGNKKVLEGMGITGLKIAK